jgi:hypothetical protein
MSDVVDIANELAHVGTDRAVQYARSIAASIPVGETGECELCGEWSGRLVKGACAPCRDKYRLP